MAEDQSMNLLTDTPSSGASPLPHFQSALALVHRKNRATQLFQQRRLRTARVLVAGRRVAHVAAVRLQAPAVGVVSEVAFQLFLDAHDQLLAFHREAGLYTLIEVALHPVGTGEEHLLFAAVEEVEHPGVFQEAADDRAHVDVVGNPRNARAQAAHATHHQVDAHTGLAGLVQRADDLRIGQRVELGDDVRRFAVEGELGLAGNHVEHALFERERRVQQLLHAQGLAHADQLAEQLADVFTQRVVGGQQAVVGVELGVAGVVVASAQVRVTHNLAGFAAQDQHHLGVGLETDHAVDHHGTGRLQAAGQLQVGLFVKTRTQLDHRGDFLAVSRGVYQCVDDFRVGAGAVQRLAHSQNMWVLGGLAQQVDHRGERLERVQQQNVLLAHHAEDVLAVLEQFRDLRRERRVLQLRVAVQAGDAEQARQVDRAVDLVQLALAEIELLEQVVRQVFRAGVGHFQAHRIAVAAREQLTAQGAGQVFDVFGVQRQVGVTGQAELVAALDLHALEQVIGVRVDHRRQEYIVVASAADFFRNLDHTRQQTRCRDDRQAGIATEGVDTFELDDEVQALVHQQRERVRRIEADRGDDRRDLVAEEAAYPGLELGGPVATTNEADLMFFQFRQQNVVEDRVLTVDVTVHQFADPRQRLVRLQAIGAGLFTGKGDLLLQAGHANLEELVQVAGEDQQKLQPLQQRIGLIQRLFQHADVELQLRELAMDVQAAVIQAGNGNRRRRRSRGLGHHRDGSWLHIRRGFVDLLHHGLGFLYCNFRESFGIHRMFLGGLFLLS